MSEIHIGPHTRDDATAPHGQGETHHTFDREISLKAIAKWVGGLLLFMMIVQFVVWFFLGGLRSFDARNDPELLPIEQEMKMNEQPPPEPRLQVTPAFEKLNPDAISRSDVEDMQALREREDKALGTPSWIDRGQGRVRVPIDVAMEVIASRGAAAAAPPAAAPAADGQRSTESAGAAQGQEQQPAPQPPASQEQ